MIHDPTMGVNDAHSAYQTASISISEFVSLKGDLDTGKEKVTFEPLSMSFSDSSLAIRLFNRPFSSLKLTVNSSNAVTLASNSLTCRSLRSRNAR